MGIAKAQALELPVLSRVPTATATTANVRKVTSRVEDMAMGEAMARNTAMVEWRESTATAIIADARTDLDSRARVVMDTREAAAAEIIDHGFFLEKIFQCNFLLILMSLTWLVF